MLWQVSRFTSFSILISFFFFLSHSASFIGTDALTNAFSKFYNDENSRALKVVIKDGAFEEGVEWEEGAERERGDEVVDAGKRSK